MADEKEATRICGQCHKEVAEANFDLHVSHCSRFLCLCPDCDENVPRSELNKHREEQHTQVRCSKCQKKMERRHLTEHEEEDCPERLGCCEFCELEMAVKDLDEHTVVCGSRTERCPDCNRYVKLSDQKDHNKTCSGPNQDPKSQQGGKDTSPKQGDKDPVQGASGQLPKLKVSCKVCTLKFPVDEINKHELICAAASKWSSDSDSDDDEWSTDFLNPRFRHMYQDPDDLYQPDFPRPNPPRPDFPRPDLTRLNGPSLGASSQDPLDLGTCPHCQLMLPRSTLYWHQGKCKVHTNLKQREATVSHNI